MYFSCPCTLPLSVSWADRVWFKAKLLADGALHVARMLASGAWISLLNKYYRDGLLPKMV